MHKGFGDDHLNVQEQFVHSVECASAALHRLLREANITGFCTEVGELGALSDLDNIAVRIADVATRLALFGYWFCDELRSSTFP